MTDRVKEIKALVADARIDIDRLDVLNAFMTIRDAGGRVEELGVLGLANTLYSAVLVILGPDMSAAVFGDAPKASEVIVAARACTERLAPEMERLIGMLNDLVETAGD